MWESDSDDEKLPAVKQPSSGEDDLNENGDELHRIRTRYLKALMKKERKKAEKAEKGEQADEFSVVVSSRGRVRKVRARHKDDIYDYGDGEDGNRSKATETSNPFHPDGSRRRKKDPDSEGADPTYLNRPRIKKESAAADDPSKKQIVYTVGTDGVLKHVDVQNASGKQVIGKRGTSRSAKRSRKNADLPATDSTQMTPINVCGKTLLVQNPTRQQPPPSGQISLVSPSPGGAAAAATPPASRSEVQVVQLHNANGSLQKIISLSHAQKLLAASRKSPISSQKGVVTKPDGSILVPVVDDQGKVLYLKMKKNAPPAAADNSGVGPKPPTKPTAAPKQSNILRSIIQTSIGEVGNANNAIVKQGRIEPKVVQNVPTTNQLILGQGLLNRRLTEAAAQNNLIRVVNTDGKSVLLRVPTSTQNITQVISSAPIQSSPAVTPQVFAVQSPAAPSRKKPPMHLSIERQLKTFGRTPSKLKNIAPRSQPPPPAVVSQKELTDAVSSLQDQTFVESATKSSNTEQTTTTTATTTRTNVEVPSTNKGVRVIVNKGGQMMPVTLSSEQLAGLTAGGSYVLNIKTGKLVPVSSAMLAQRVAGMTTNTTTNPVPPQP